MTAESFNLRFTRECPLLERGPELAMGAGLDEDNRRRAFGPVASLDAWHEGFAGTHKKAKLFVDVSFSEARIGGEPGDEVRFRLRLRRAEVVVLISPTEGLGIDPASVSRDAPNIRGQRTEVLRRSSDVASDGAIAAGASARGLSAKARAGVSAKARRQAEEALKLVEDVSNFAVLQVQTVEGDYAWEIKPAISGRPFQGRPWDALAEPRLTVVDRGVSAARRIEPTVNVEIRCLREDLEILEITPVQKRDLAVIARDPFSANKHRAAEAIIRTRLARAGLLRGDIADQYAQIVLCATLAVGP